MSRARRDPSVHAEDAGVRSTAGAGRGGALGLGRFGMLIPFYVVLLVALSLAGTNNRQLLSQQFELLDSKTELQAAAAIQRREAAVVNGPASVATWARAQGMLPVSEARGASLVAPSVAPVLDYPTSSLELRTVWR